MYFDFLLILDVMTGLRVCKVVRFLIKIKVTLDSFNTSHCFLVLAFLNITHMSGGRGETW
jgi:hypothetical protein